ncbi:MAG TPA: AEC family transporter [Steroidobacteraceae bacterium]|nr:AEC family transporter [Steroidobacteraceae bacterium]
MGIVWHFVRLSLPLYGLVALGYATGSLPRWPRAWSTGASRAVFSIALPAMLFEMMSHRAALPAANPTVLAAYFGSCLIVFVVGRLIARWRFKMDGVAQSVFALGGIFSNIVLTGLPIARATLGDQAVPVVALLVVFNALTLWTLVSVSVEWSLHGALSARGIAKTALNVLRNPIILSIVTGTLLGRSGYALPATLDRGLALIGDAAGPAALLVLGLELTGFRVREAWATTMTLCAVKLVLQPLVVWLLALALGLSALELRSAVLVASMSVGVNVYLMAVRFETLQGPIASGIVVSNILAALTTPLLLAALQAADHAR